MRWAICIPLLLASCATPAPEKNEVVRLATSVSISPPLERNAREGQGSPVIVPDGKYSFAAKTAISAGAETLLLDPDGDPNLAADFVAPLAAYFRALPQLRDRINGVLVPERYPSGDRLIRVGDTPGKTPVVLVHGLGASPHTWKKLSARLLTSREFRSRYTLWHYRYPTGAPLGENAIHFLRDLEVAFEDDRTKAVIIGHSMGGLLALAAATDPATARHLDSVVLLACPASGNWYASLPQAKIASHLPGIADLSSSSEFIRDLTSRRVPGTIPVHVVLGRKLTFRDGSFSDGIVRSTDSYTRPTTTYIVPARSHQIHKRAPVIDYVAKLLALAP